MEHSKEMLSCVCLSRIIVMIWWAGLAPWEFESPFPGSLASSNVVRNLQMEHSKEMQESKVEDMKQRLFKAHKQIRSKELADEELGEHVKLPIFNI